MKRIILTRSIKVIRDIFNKYQTRYNLKEK